MVAVILLVSGTPLARMLVKEAVDHLVQHGTYVVRGLGCNIMRQFTRVHLNAVLESPAPVFSDVCPRNQVTIKAVFVGKRRVQLNSIGSSAPKKNRSSNVMSNVSMLGELNVVSKSFTSSDRRRR